MHTSTWHPRKHHPPQPAKEEKDRGRKNAATRTISQFAATAERIRDGMKINGTHHAFTLVIRRMRALRNGVRTAEDPQDIKTQIEHAETLLQRCRAMQSWSPGEFSRHYTDLELERPKRVEAITQRGWTKVRLPRRKPGNVIPRRNKEDEGVPRFKQKGSLFIAPESPAPIGELDVYYGDIPASPPADAAAAEAVK